MCQLLGLFDWPPGALAAPPYQAAGGDPPGLDVLEAVEALRRRSLLERTDRGPSFDLQSVVLEYVTDQLVEDVTHVGKQGDLTEVKPGFALFTMTPAFKHYNPIGTVHGGVASTLLDSCMSCAIQTHLAKGFGYTTLELKVNLVRPITEKTGPVRAEGRSLYVGRRSGTAEGKIIDASGTLLAHGTTTCMIFPL